MNKHEQIWMYTIFSDTLIGGEVLFPRLSADSRSSIIIQWIPPNHAQELVDFLVGKPRVGVSHIFDYFGHTHTHNHTHTQARSGLRLC